MTSKANIKEAVGDLLEPTASAPDDREKTEVEKIRSEEEDRASSPAHYEIVTYPADFTLEVLVQKLKERDSSPPEIQIPGFQRKFVWTQTQASRLIESFLLGLTTADIQSI
jgi:hypothetical protein